MVKSILQTFREKIRQTFDRESKQLFKNSTWVFGANVLGVVLAFLRSVLIARGLGAEILGAYSVVVAFVLTIQEIIKLNVALGVIKYGAHYVSGNRPDKLMALLKGGVLASQISAAVSVLIIALMAQFTYHYFFDIPGLQQFIIWYSIVCGFAFLDNIGRGVLKIYYKFKLNSIVQMIMDTFEFLMIAFCIYFYPHNLTYFFWTVIITKFVNSLICNTAVLIELRKELGAQLKTKMSLLNDERKEISHFIIGHSFSNTLKTFMNQGDVLILSWWSNSAAVGFYTVAKKLAYSVLAITDPLVTSIYPQLSHLVSQSKFQEAKTMLIRLTRMTLLPVTIFMVAAFFLKDLIITTIYGKSYAPAATSFFIHLVGAIQGSIFFWALPLIQSLGLTAIRLRAYLFAIGLDLIVSWWLTPQFGAAGVAFGLLSANLLISILFIHASYLHIEKSIKSSLSTI